METREILISLDVIFHKIVFQFHQDSTLHTCEEHTEPNFLSNGPLIAINPYVLAAQPPETLTPVDQESTPGLGTRPTGLFDSGGGNEPSSRLVTSVAASPGNRDKRADALQQPVAPGLAF